MIKRTATPMQANRGQQANKEMPTRAFGKDLKNVINFYHNKLSESNSKSANKLTLQDDGKKLKLTQRNNSQVNMKNNKVKNNSIREDLHKKEEEKCEHMEKTGKQVRSVGEST